MASVIVRSETQGYSVEGMSEPLLTFLQHLREFGLVFQRKRKSRRYYPTRLVITLSAGVSANSSSTAMGAAPGTGDSGFIVVEINYHLYPYTIMNQLSPLYFYKCEPTMTFIRIQV
ncbi:general transcription factor IIH subunit 4 [Salmo salar]|uniref:General transcription factor IIH subunit 4 n=1 Tax=Salmo salar TaxID=8030 RepID=A0ABM3E365_SALSA|nr:general transcription factor IIH subunit 4 [Salmo salar]